MKAISLLRSVTPLLLTLVILSAAGLPGSAHSSALSPERPIERSSKQEAGQDARPERVEEEEARETRPERPGKEEGTGRAEARPAEKLEPAGGKEPPAQAIPSKPEVPPGEHMPGAPDKPAGPVEEDRDGGASSHSPGRSPAPKSRVSIEEIAIYDPCRVSGAIRLSGPYTGEVTLRLTYHVTGSSDYAPSGSSWTQDFDEELDAEFVLPAPWDSGSDPSDEGKISSYRVEVDAADPEFTNMTAKSTGFRCDDQWGDVPGASPSPTATTGTTPTPTTTAMPEPTATPLPTSPQDPTSTSTAVPTATYSPTSTSTPTPTLTPTPENGGRTEIGPDNQSSVYPGSVAVYEHTVTNLGPASDAKEISTSSSAGWPVSVFHAGGSTPLTDSNRNGSVDTGTLRSGESTTVVVKVAVPVGALRGARDVTTVTASSAAGYGPGGSDSATDATTVLGVITLALSTPDVTFGRVSPSGAPPSEVPGVSSETDDLGANYVKSGAVQVTVRSNSSWSGEVRAIENSGSASTIRIADGDLQWRLRGNEDWSPLSLSSTSFASGSAGSSSLEYDYRLRVDWEDDPGGFTSVVSYNVSQ